MGTVSHELRTPLATIKTGASALLSDAEWTEDERDEFLGEIDAEVDRLALMVGNLLDLSRIEGGALRPRLECHDVGELAADVVGRRPPDRHGCPLGPAAGSLRLRPGRPDARQSLR